MRVEASVRNGVAGAGGDMNLARRLPFVCHDVNPQEQACHVDSEHSVALVAQPVARNEVGVAVMKIFGSWLLRVMPFWRACLLALFRFLNRWKFVMGGDTAMMMVRLG